MARKKLGSGSGPEHEDGARAQAGRKHQPSRDATADKPQRIVAGRNRRVQLARTGGRKLFGKAAKKVFLEWFAATCNIGWAAEKAGFNYKTVLKHRMNDPVFAADFDRAMAQGYARLEAKRLETKRKEAPIGIEGDWDAPEMDEMDPMRVDAILRERGRQIAHPEMARKQGRRPRVASNAEVRAALEKRLKAFHARERSRSSGADAPPGQEAPPPSSGRSPSPRNRGEDME